MKQRYILCDTDNNWVSRCKDIKEIFDLFNDMVEDCGFQQAFDKLHIIDLVNGTESEFVVKTEHYDEDTEDIKTKKVK